jgi:predicted ribosomally synthesized peptide with nif11-like leader
MSLADPEAFVEPAERDEAFAKELESLSADPYAVIAKMHEAGYDATPDEVKEVFLDRYGAELTPEHMDVIAAGADPDMVQGVVATVAMGVTNFAALAVAAAAN